MSNLRNLLFIVAAAASLSLLSCKGGEKVEEQRWSEKMAVSEMTRFPELWMIENASKPKWSYPLDCSQISDRIVEGNRRSAVF